MEMNSIEIVEVEEKTKTSKKRTKLSKEQISEIFRNHDQDGDGRLSPTELTKAFCYVGALLPAYRARKALTHADSNGDGFISEGEFESLVDYTEKRKYPVV